MLPATRRKKDEELEELRELCIQTQAKLCTDAADEDNLQSQLAKKDAEIAELMQVGAAVFVSNVSMAVTWQPCCER